MIRVIKTEAPSIEPAVQRELDLLTPRVFMRWNHDFAPEPFSAEIRQGRWEIWCELTDNTHPKNSSKKLAAGDEWNTDAQCWMRFLQTYQTREGDFAPVDHRLIIGLEMADTWKNRRFYEDHVEDPDALADLRVEQARRETLIEGARYYNGWGNTSVGRYVNSGWRGALGF